MRSLFREQYITVTLGCLWVFAAGALPAEELLTGYPAKTVQEAEQLAARLAASGEEGIASVTARIVPMGTGDDTAARFAISGLAKYAGTPGREAERALTTEALIGALQQATDFEVQNFYMSLLQEIGRDDAVPALAEYLANAELSDPAARALQAIGSEAACTALTQGLAGAKDSAAVSILQAISGAGCADATDAVRPFTQEMNPAVKTAALTALADLGDARAAKMLREHKDPELYLRLARTLQAQGKHLKAARIAQQVLDHVAEDVPAHTAALNLLVQARGDKSVKALEQAIASERQDLRVAALRALAGLQSRKADAVLQEALDSGQPALRADALRILGHMHYAPALQAARTGLAHPDLPVRLAAVDALVHLAGTDAFDTLVERRNMNADSLDEESLVLDAAIEAVRPALGAPLGQADAEGFVPIFNGKDLTGWTGDKNGYTAEDGKIVCHAGGKLYTVEDFADFTLRFEFQLTPGANNGIGLRMAPGTHASIMGMEIQILDDTSDKYSDIQPYQFCGSIYGVAAPEQGHLKPVGEWNEMEITAKGPQITIMLNGAKIVDANVQAIKDQGTPDAKDHPGLDRKTGRLAFLGHGSELSYRNLRVKRL